MPISSPGLASGIDVKGIVSQLVALERAPLAPLQKQATSFQAKLSVYGTIRSMVSSIGDTASKLAGDNAFNLVKGTSSNAEAVGITVASGTAPTGFAVEVQKLATAQSSASASVPVGTAMGAGTMTITLGDWSSGTFVPGSTPGVPITVEAGKDTLTEIAAQINGKDAGVTATVLRDASGERLLLRSKDTGEAQGFEIHVEDGESVANAGLSRLALETGVASGVTVTHATNAEATINNIPVESASNTLKDALPGITLQFKQQTSGPVEMGVTRDKDGMRKNIQAFVDAYNALNDMLVSSTSFDPDTKVAGSLQGDSTAVGLQNAMRSMMRSLTPGGSLQRLSDIGIEIKTGGKMTIGSKLDDALDDPEAMKQLFSAQSDDPTQRGFGLKIKAFADGLNATGGAVANRNESLRNAIKRTEKEMDKVVDRASRAEARYLAQYNAMDAAVARMNALSAYVTQQITLWNKSGSR